MEWLAELGGLGNLTAGAVLLIVILVIVRAMVRGDLIPASMHERISAAQAAQIATQQRIIDRTTAQVDLAVEYGETTVKLLRAIAPDEEGSP